MGIYRIRCCGLLRHLKTNQVPGTTEIINHPHHHHQLTSSNSSRSLLLVLLRVAVVVVVAAGCGGGDGYLYVAVVLVVVVKFHLVRTWYQLNGFCADAHRLTVKVIYQDLLPNYMID